MKIFFLPADRAPTAWLVPASRRSSKKKKKKNAFRKSYLRATVFKMIHIKTSRSVPKILLLLLLFSYVRLDRCAPLITFYSALTTVSHQCFNIIRRNKINHWPLFFFLLSFPESYKNRAKNMFTLAWVIYSYFAFVRDRTWLTLITCDTMTNNEQRSTLELHIFNH